MEPLEDQELHEMVREWKAPGAPPQLRERLFPAPAAWWRRWWHIEIRVPLPLAVCLVLLLALVYWRGPEPQPVDSGQTAKVLTFRELTPVTELKPRIIRRDNAQN